MQNYLRPPGLRLRLVNLPCYSPDFNVDEAIWGRVRWGETRNLCLRTDVLVQEKVSSFLDRLTCRKEDVKQQCRSVL